MAILHSPRSSNKSKMRWIPMQQTAAIYIRNNKNHRQINQKCGGFRCRGQPQLYIRNNKNDRQIKKCSEQLHNFTFVTIRTFVKQIKNAVDSIALDSFAILHL